MDFGFEKSSMRGISKRCGITAAGIYRHCVDKEDLFHQIVFPAVERINHWLDAHTTRYVDAVSNGEHIQWRDSEIDMMREIIYPNMEEYHYCWQSHGVANTRILSMILQSDSKMSS